jgi:hypothetical protein
MFFQELLEFFWHKFSIIVIMQHFDILPCLILYKKFEFFELKKNNFFWS